MEIAEILTPALTRWIVLHRVRCGGWSPTHSGGVTVRRPWLLAYYYYYYVFQFNSGVETLADKSLQKFRNGKSGVILCILYTRALEAIRTFFQTARIIRQKCFYHASYASAVYAVVMWPSVCPSVRLSVTSRSSTKVAKPRITQITPYDSPGILVFWCQKYRRNPNEIIPTGAPNADGIGKSWQISTNNSLYLENGTR